MFDPQAYGPRVARILALDGNGERLMPLANGTCSSSDAYRILKDAFASELFPGSRAPEAALSGLFLYFSCLDESHTISQSIETPDGSYWHGIMHRQEPDPGNASYWFRRVGKHSIFPALARAAGELGYGNDPWDPLSFIDDCERAPRGAKQEELLLRVQLAEWQLLFDHCAKPVKP